MFNKTDTCPPRPLSHSHTVWDTEQQLAVTYYLGPGNFQLPKRILNEHEFYFSQLGRPQHLPGSVSQTKLHNDPVLDG